MSGHSRWAGIKHKKGAADAARGKLFSKLIREITVAAKLGGGNPDNNPRLRKAIEDAKDANMPQENIKRAIQRGTGEIPGASYEEVSYEGYGPGGAAVLVEAITDNRNRTTAEIRKIFSQFGGNMGETGCVAWIFSPRGYIVVPKNAAPEEKVMEIALATGAEDVKSDDEEIYEVTTAPADLEKVKEAFLSAGVTPSSAETTMLPSTYVHLEGKDAQQILNLMNALEEHDDVRNVYSNFDIPREVVVGSG